MLLRTSNQTTQNSQMQKDFGIKGKKREPISSLMILTGFFNMRKVRRFCAAAPEQTLYRGR